MGGAAGCGEMDGDTGGDIDGGGAGCADGMTMPCASANAAGLGEALDWPARRGAAGSTGAAFWPDAAAWMTTRQPHSTPIFAHICW